LPQSNAEVGEFRQRIDVEFESFQQLAGLLFHRTPLENSGASQLRT
jgi:hypothetical protein